MKNEITQEDVEDVTDLEGPAAALVAALATNAKEDDG